MPQLGNLKSTLLTICLLISSVTAFGQNVRTYIPEKAKIHLPVLVKEQTRLWPDHPLPELLAGLAETESCITLTHRRCWGPSAKLSSSRELGVGIPQITKAFNPDGSIRFDSLKDIRAAHMSELRELSWQNVETRPDLQLRILILMNRDNYQRLFMIPEVLPRLTMTNAAYNGGLKGVHNDRRACGLKNGCDPNLWFGHVELTCTKSRKPLYHGKSACDINRYHSDRVINISSNKYKPFFLPIPVKRAIKPSPISTLEAIDAGDISLYTFLPDVLSKSVVLVFDNTSFSYMSKNIIN